jgi:Fic family protein
MSTPATPPSLDGLAAKWLEDGESRSAEFIEDFTQLAQRRDYLHWDELRRRKPPAGLTIEQWWFMVKMRRMASARSLEPLADSGGNPFSYNLTDSVLKRCDELVWLKSDRIELGGQMVDSDDQRRRLVDSWVSEAITSSQLEGAATTRRVAEEMLRSGRKPRDHSERMIANNYDAIRFVSQRRDDPLTPEFLLEIHRIVTDGTLNDPADAGRIQTADEKRVGVWDRSEDRFIHTPPKAEELPRRLELLCDFGNGKFPKDSYLPPVLRAITLHFLVGYDHYFVDGNGRTARTLFYWSLLHEGYQLAEYLTISNILNNAPIKYGRAYLLTETDAGDLTYFFLYQLEVLSRATTELRQSLRDSAQNLRDAQARAQRLDDHLNHRQLVVVDHALRHPGFRYTAESHAASHRITTQTARTDLDALVKADILVRTQDGRRFTWHPSPDLASLL